MNLLLTDCNHRVNAETFSGFDLGILDLGCVCQPIVLVM